MPVGEPLLNLVHHSIVSIPLIMNSPSSARLEEARLEVSLIQLALSDGEMRELADVTILV